MKKEDVVVLLLPSSFIIPSHKLLLFFIVHIFFLSLQRCFGLAWINARCPPKPLYHSPSSAGHGRGNRMKAWRVEKGQGGITHRLLSQTKQTELGEKRKI